MPNSFATTAHTTCDYCNHPFYTDVWLIVDTIERPDLLDRICANTLHTLACPHCAKPGMLDAPLLVYQPNTEPHLLFSPATDTNADEDRAEAKSLLDQLRQADPEAGRNGAADALLVVPRPLLLCDALNTDPMALQQLVTNLRQRTQQQVAPIFTLIEQFVRAQNWEESLRIVQAHPVLLDKATIKLFEPLIAQQDQEVFRQILAEHKALLQRCRLVGVVRAFTEKTGSRQNTIFDELAQMTQLSDMPRRIVLCRQELAIVERSSDPQQWAGLQAVLGDSLKRNPLGSRGQNLEEAIAAYQQALQVITREAMPIFWATILNNLADAYANRVRGRRAQNWEEAIDALQQALQVRTREAMPIEWAQTMMNLANAYAHRYRGGRAQNLEEAINALQQTLQVNTREAVPIEWAQTMANLANAYAERIWGERAQNLEKAIATYQQALQVNTRDAMPIEWAQIMVNLANAYTKRIWGERAQNLEKAIVACQQALIIQTKDALPENHRHTQCVLGHAYLAARRWGEAASAFQAALAVNETLYAAASTPEARQTELHALSNAPAALAYALARQPSAGDEALAAAVVTLDRNRARWLAESIALRREQPVGVDDSLWQHFTEAAEAMRILITESQLPDSTTGKRDFLTLSSLLATARQTLESAIEQVRAVAPEFMPQPSFAEIQKAVTNDNAIIYMLMTEVGGLAMIVHTDGVQPVWLDLTEPQLRAWLVGLPEETQRSGWLGAYQAWLYQRNTIAEQAWFNQVETTTQQLWDIVMGPLTAALQTLPTPPTTVTLIPTGLLALLPLHAAWHTTKESGTKKRYFLDDFAVRYAPSALALRHAQERLATVKSEHVLAINEPKPIKNGGPLLNSAAEVAAIVDHFPEVTTLAHASATRQAVLDALAAGVDVAHFSCHGSNNWQAPLETGLLMANAEPLTVRDLLELRLPGARLATLSACETGLAGTNLPDEVVMLPSALLQAGFAGVAASLWSVADVSTAMLMARFYDLWQNEGVAPVHALRQAQLWVRDTTNREKADYFAAHLLALQPSGATKMAEGVAAEFFARMELYEGGPEASSFEHPFWWAAFTFTGV